MPPTWSHGLTIVASVFAGLGFALWHSKRAGAPTSSRLMAASMDVDLVPAPVAMVAASGRKVSPPAPTHTHTHTHTLHQGPRTLHQDREQLYRVLVLSDGIERWCAVVVLSDLVQRDSAAC